MDRDFLGFRRRTQSTVASHLVRAGGNHQSRELSVFGHPMKVMRAMTELTASAIELCWVPLTQSDCKELIKNPNSEE
jgi:hypothetical protein